jgi:hypothetical protein
MTVGGIVVLHAVDSQSLAMTHERATHAVIARELAALKEYKFVDGDRRELGSESVYVVPSDTLTSLTDAQSLGVHDDSDLFGGVVPFGFVATKAISHPLVGPGAIGPIGWSHGFSALVEGSVLRGYSAFGIPDVYEAARRLLAHGPVRLKPTRETAGRGQKVVESLAEIEGALASLDATELATQGLVLEENLVEVTTRSVGQVRVAGLVASYHGIQGLTHDNSGAEVYGGSKLTVVRGGFDALLALGLAPEIELAIAQARVYDDAVGSEYRGFFASRRNYDVVQGLDALGTRRSGVLEQSWRVGGASGAEVLALAVMKADPALQVVHAATVERYGAGNDPPPHASVLFRGNDPDVGLITKYALVEPHGDTR